MALICGVFASGLFWGCANMGIAPQGGPKDTLPPRVVGMTPPFNTTNLKPGRIAIEFDEYVQLKDLQNEFFTSPFMQRKPTASIKGRGVVVDIKSELDSNMTYVLNFGSSVVDNNEGNPYVGLKYTFSTGNEIDSLYMSGYVSDARTTDTVKKAFILFFDAKADSTELDSVVHKSRALAVARTMPNGVFVHENLKAMDYRIYAMVDHNGNQMYDPGVDDIAFTDTVYNPARMPSFLLWYDSVKMYQVAEPQIFLQTFRENPDRRQNLSKFERPQAQELMLRFTSKFPKIERFSLQGIDSTRIIRERAKETGDSLLYWLDIPADELPDTIVGDIVYQRHDSAGVLYPHRQELRFVYKKPFVRKKDRKDEEREEADTVPKKSELKYTVKADNPLIPDNGMEFQFELPLVRLDKDRITLTHTDIRENTQEVPFELVRDTMNLRRYYLKTDWQHSDAYKLVIPPGALMTMDGEENDTIVREFTVADPEKFGSLIVNLTGTTPEYEYIIQVTDEKGSQILKETAHLREGKNALNFITPGTVQLRVTEDRNRNGKWDTGDLIRRIRPEKVETFRNPANGSSNIIAKANWEMEFDIDVSELFKPRQHVSMADSLQTHPEGKSTVLSSDGTRVEGLLPADTLQNAAAGQAPVSSSDTETETPRTRREKKEERKRQKKEGRKEETASEAKDASGNPAPATTTEPAKAAQP